MQVMIGIDIAYAQSVAQIFSYRVVLLIDARIDLRDDISAKLIWFLLLVQIVFKSGVHTR